MVSIIVVVFRDRTELAELIHNLAPFRSDQVELIVIDGGSDDGSREYLAEQRDALDIWVSEPDQGIYDAMNKGLAAARGDYILHINAGDRVFNLPLARLRIYAEQKVDVVCCRVLEDGSYMYVPRNDWLLRFDNTWHHQGTFYRREAHLGYDPSYRVFGDFDHNQRLRKVSCSVTYLDLMVATHKTNGISRTGNAQGEMYRSIRRNFGLLHVVPAFARFQLLRLRALLRELSRGRT